MIAPATYKTPPLALARGKAKTKCYKRQASSKPNVKKTILTFCLFMNLLVLDSRKNTTSDNAVASESQENIGT